MGQDGVHHAEFSEFASGDREAALQQLVDSYVALASDQDNWVCNLANAASLLWHAYRSLPLDVNWAGFYVADGKNANTLILGPFQGKVACQIIKYGHGVCGTAASLQETQLVPDVNAFPGHIACDGETKSEIVIPIIGKNKKVVGVIDIDCLTYDGFSGVDVKYLEQLASKIAETCEFP
ncbi:LAMI_0E05358g1_1 [Lachancea mirantina]|uniref:LAMI_0E05358g1_1 n=1 Tax=Lachancea mirantina TaxID=1230905 RepID=A0A1G4JLC1_9SACH|nr:LAMI_0E05358g1_1 [Lachancea mirantina]